MVGGWRVLPPPSLVGSLVGWALFPLFLFNINTRHKISYRVVTCFVVFLNPYDMFVYGRPGGLFILIKDVTP